MLQPGCFVQHEFGILERNISVAAKFPRYLKIRGVFAQRGNRSRTILARSPRRRRLSDPTNVDECWNLSRSLKAFLVGGCCIGRMLAATINTIQRWARTAMFGSKQIQVQHFCGRNQDVDGKSRAWASLHKTNETQRNEAKMFCAITRAQNVRFLHHSCCHTLQIGLLIMTQECPKQDSKLIFCQQKIKGFFFF